MLKEIFGRILHLIFGQDPGYMAYARRYLCPLFATDIHVNEVSKWIRMTHVLDFDFCGIAVHSAGLDMNFVNV